jgi:hypothetical protein
MKRHGTLKVPNFDIAITSTASSHDVRSRWVPINRCRFGIVCLDSDPRCGGDVDIVDKQGATVRDHSKDIIMEETSLYLKKRVIFEIAECECTAFVKATEKRAEQESQILLISHHAQPRLLAEKLPRSATILSLSAVMHSMPEYRTMI